MTKHLLVLVFCLFLVMIGFGITLQIFTFLCGAPRQGRWGLPGGQRRFTSGCAARDGRWRIDGRGEAGGDCTPARQSHSRGFSKRLNARC